MSAVKSPSDAIAVAADMLGSQAELARQLGVAPSFVTQLALGLRKVPVRIAVQIERLTQGKVTVEQLCPEVDWSFIRCTKRRKVA